jgi:hypothetical protein
MNGMRDSRTEVARGIDRIIAAIRTALDAHWRAHLIAPHTPSDLPPARHTSRYVASFR